MCTPYLHWRRYQLRLDDPAGLTQFETKLASSLPGSCRKILRRECRVDVSTKIQPSAARIT
jgi:hypothetical protein